VTHRIFARALGAALGLLALAAPAFAQFADQQTFVGSSTGSSNAYAISTVFGSQMTDFVGVRLKFLPNFTNNGASTISINGLTPVPIRKPTNAGPAALQGGEIVASPTQLTCGVWDGTQFLLTCNLNASPGQSLLTPQGYLTPCQVSSGAPVSGCPVGEAIQTGDVVSATTLYYEPFVGGQIPIFNGVSFQVQTFGELPLTIPSSRLANTIYDVCITTTSAGAYNANGTPTAVFSVAWTNSNAGAGSRGTGAGTAQISQQGGLWVNTVAISGVNGATTYSIPALACTMVGTVWIDGTAGQVTAHRTWGQSRKFGYWNFYNRQRIILKVGDSTASWSTATGPRPSNGNSANSLTVLSGLAEEIYFLRFLQRESIVPTAAAGSEIQIGIGFNSTSAFTGTRGIVGAVWPTGSTSTGFVENSILGQYQAPPSVGINTVTSLESVPAASGSFTSFGTESNMLLSAEWRG